MGNGIMLTPLAVEKLRQLFDVLKAGFGHLEMIGSVVSGFGEGRKYMRIYSKRLSLILGITPFAGTLNIRLDDVQVRK